MTSELSETLNELVSKLQKTIDMIRPNVVLGDDDSIHLTDHQLGCKAGLELAIRHIEQISTG